MNLWLIFLTGLTTGGITCAALQGGILTAIVVSLKKSSAKSSLGLDDWLPVASFLVTKLLSHLVLGALLGWVGSRAELSLTMRLIFQGIAALFMLAAAANLLSLHPIFRYLVIQPPMWAYRLAKNSSNLQSVFAPAVFGFLTVLIPCGVTQAMEVVAASSGSALTGSLILGAFVLGTFPTFTLIGLFGSRATGLWRTQFLRLAAALLVFMSLYSVNGILTALDSPYSVQKISAVLRSPVGTSLPPVLGGVQKVTLAIENSGYSPSRFAVKNGVPVELTLRAGKVYSCALSFTFPAFRINKFINPESLATITFTPTKKGLYTYTCSMGMYSGTMEVI